MFVLTLQSVPWSGLRARAPTRSVCTRSGERTKRNRPSLTHPAKAPSCQETGPSVATTQDAAAVRAHVAIAQRGRRLVAAQRRKRQSSRAAATISCNKLGNCTQRDESHVCSVAEILNASTDPGDA